MDTCVHRAAIAFRDLVLFYGIGSNLILYSLHAYCGVLFQSASEEISSGCNADDYHYDNTYSNCGVLIKAGRSAGLFFRDDPHCRSVRRL